MINILGVNHSANLFYRIDVQRIDHLDKETKELVGYINSSWADIEYLNYLFHKNFGNFDKDLEFNMTFSALLVLSDNFYVHLSTIYLLMKKLGNKYKDVRKLISLNKKILERFQTIRNCIIVHKEKDFYKKQLASMSHTDPSHLIENKVVVVDGKTGKEEVYTLKPLKDIYLMSRLLQNLEHLLIVDNDRV